MFSDYRIVILGLAIWWPMKTETILDPIDMTEELMFHIFNNDMNRELDGRWLDLYLSLQHYLDYQNKIEREADERS